MNIELRCNWVDCKGELARITFENSKFQSSLLENKAACILCGKLYDVSYVSVTELRGE